jgi:hypothetical protein
MAIVIGMVEMIKLGSVYYQRGCDDGNSKNSENKTANTASTFSGLNSTSPIIDGIILSESNCINLIK